jgi:hypothetical protein
MFDLKGHHRAAGRSAHLRFPIDDLRSLTSSRVYRKSYIVNPKIVRTKIYPNIRKYSHFAPPGGLLFFHPLIRPANYQKPLSHNRFLNSPCKIYTPKSCEFTPQNTRFFIHGQPALKTSPFTVFEAEDGYEHQRKYILPATFSLHLPPANCYICVATSPPTAAGFLS